MILNKTQTELLKKKQNLNLNFDYELNMNNEKKEKLHINVLNNLDVLIEDLLDQGVKFYKIDFIEEINKIETAFIEVEHTINYCSSKISMIEFIYLIIKKNTLSTFKIECIIATRTLINGNILSSIKNIFNELNENTEIKYLDGYDEIKKNWSYVIKDKNYKFHRFVYFSKFYHNLYGILAELEVTFFPECGYDLSFFENALDSDIKGISGQNNSNEKICLNLLNIFFHNNNFRLIFDGIYVRTNKSKFSYNLFYNINYIDSNIFKILSDLKLKYEIQLKKLDIQDLVLNCWDKFFETTLKKNRNYFNNIEYHENLIEFNDGLYFMDKNYFFNFNENNEFEHQNIVCYKYFDKSFEKCLNSIPEKWLNEIKKSLVFEIEIKKFISELGMYFNSKFIVNNNKIIILKNFNNLLDINKIIVNFSLFNTESEIIEPKLFFFNHYEDKKTLVCNYYSNDIRNSKGNLIFEFNQKIPDKMLNDKIFIIKLLIYTFTFSCCDCERNNIITKILDEELAQIILYCNSLFFTK